MPEPKPTFMPARLSPLEETALKNAVAFSAIVFRGRGQYDKTIVETHEAARAVARELFEGDRSVMIYAIDPHGTTAMIETYGR